MGKEDFPWVTKNLTNLLGKLKRHPIEGDRPEMLDGVLHPRCHPYFIHQVTVNGSGWTPTDNASPKPVVVLVLEDVGSEQVRDSGKCRLLVERVWGRWIEVLRLPELHKLERVRPNQTSVEHPVLVSGESHVWGLGQVERKADLGVLFRWTQRGVEDQVSIEKQTVPMLLNPDLEDVHLLGDCIFSVILVMLCNSFWFM